MNRSVTPLSGVTSAQVSHSQHPPPPCVWRGNNKLSRSDAAHRDTSEALVMTASANRGGGQVHDFEKKLPRGVIIKITDHCTVEEVV